MKLYHAGISDHEIVSISTSVVISHSKTTERNVFQWHRANFDLIRDHISEFADTFLEVFHHTDPIDILWTEFKALCKDCMHGNDTTNKIYSATEDHQAPLPAISSEPAPNISQISVNMDGVRSLLDNLDPKKVTGPDNIIT